MIGSSRAMRVWAYAAPTDMRKSYEGLGAIVRNELGRDIMAGEVMFTNSRRSRAKVLSRRPGLCNMSVSPGHCARCGTGRRAL